MPESSEDGVELDENESCACGSGELYGDCCMSPVCQLVRLPNGKILERRPLNDDAYDSIEGARSDFQQIFGRRPQKGDRIFSAAHLDPGSDILQILLRVSEQSGKPQIAYAYQKTGLLITEQTFSNLSPRDQSDWNEAIDEFFELTENGIDPFTGVRESVRELLDNLNDFCSDCAVHFGSYVDRHRKDRHLDIHEFSQVLVLSRVQRIFLLLKNKLGAFPQFDALILIRSVFEIYFVYQFLEKGRSSGLYFLGRSSDKDGAAFSYKQKGQGKIDRSRVVFLQTGEEVPSHISFYSMAEMSCHVSDRIIFDKIYARLSDEVHFTYANWRSYWRDDSVVKTSAAADPLEVATLFLLSVAMLSDCVAKSSVQTKAVQRDATFLFRRSRKAFLFLLGNLDEAPSEIFNDQQLLAEIVNRLRSSDKSDR